MWHFQTTPAESWDYAATQHMILADLEIDAERRRPTSRSTSAGILLAWDPVAQREAWCVTLASAFNGVTLSTAGNFVSQDTSDGLIAAYRATNGERLWQSEAGTGVMAAPVTYTVDGVQYVAVAAGWGSGFALSMADATKQDRARGAGRVLVFALGGERPLPQAPPAPGPVPTPVYRVDASADEIGHGALLYARYCMLCHGPLATGGGTIPDLRYASIETHRSFREIVLGGIRAGCGMPAFSDRLDEKDAEHTPGNATTRGIFWGFATERAWPGNSAPGSAPAAPEKLDAGEVCAQADVLADAEGEVAPTGVKTAVGSPGRRR